MNPEPPLDKEGNITVMGQANNGREAVALFRLAMSMRFVNWTGERLRGKG